MSIAQYSPQDNAVLSVAIQPFSTDKEGDSWECAGQELKKLKNKFKFYSPDIACSLPTEYAIVKHIQIDREEPDVDALIEWELAQQIIGSIDEYSFDFQRCSANQNENSTDYLTVAFRHSLVERFSTLLKGMKLHPQVIDLDAFAIINTFEANYKERLYTPAVIVHGESEKTKIILTRNGDFIDMECFSYSYENLNAESYAMDLQSEISRFLAANNKIDVQPRISLYYTGSIFTQTEFRDAVSAKMGSGELLYPFRKVGCRIAIDHDQLMTYAPQLSVAVGLALRGNE
ncbi:MAG TPA: pilus assembly protein PilM [Chitinispirillaceae bacterium]|nr:pilus assembly protein PilM [Chitinispirillaceae bacterium]